MASNPDRLTDADDILDEVFNEIGDYIHSPVDRFMVRYFARFDSVLQDTVAGIIARDCYPFSLPRRPSVQDFLAWFSALSLEEQQQQHQADDLIPHGTTAAAAGGDRGILDATEATSRFLQNRILTCLVVSPAGRPLWTFQTALELLRVLRDANIVIADGHTDSVGILIDLDVALDVAGGGPASPPGEVVGTRMFMAVELLLGKGGGRHTHRHDLESFLYVLLWAAIANGSDSLPGGSRLRLWGIEKTWDDSAAHKARDMSADGFPAVLAEIPPRLAALSPLAENLRRVLFPEVVGTGTGTGTGTGADDVDAVYDAVYDAVLGAFDEAVALEAGSGRGW
ncbi:hypothetical protein B0T24DRAFT_680728 [Lasiosphaeria ovina]|uniref:Fungal-type protein kinase domain-containing protein n=1 Tax=Lasiosphaeria ovina TaxID=92902 RepID=A0AAE0K959_9PEZI|nr:hypothetical protein B0T24DRAFT_680728 [Lasiosphaeria ovina]